jgi:PAS domain S-box-containing protein
MKEKSINVLMVDDSEDDVLLIIRKLKKGGYHPIYQRVETAAAMTTALQEKRWDIILCDYKMPHFDAPSAIALFKNSNLDIPLIVVSGTIGEETAVECMRLGAQDYLMKSNLSRLCPAISRELEDAKIRTQQRISDHKLRSEEQRFRALTEQSSDIILLINKASVITYANRETERAFGRKKEEIVGTNMYDYIHPDDISLVSGLFDRFFMDTRPVVQKAELRISNKDGIWHTVEAQGTNLIQDDEVQSVIVNIRDITERKKMEEALIKSEERYRTILEDINDGYFETDLAGNFTFFNDMVCKDMGYSRSELMGMNNREYTDEKDLPEVFRVYNKVYRTAEPEKDFSWQIKRKDGTRLYVEAYISLMRDASGKPTGFRGIVRNITERKMAEKLLKESEERYRLLADHMKDQIWLMDMKMNITYVSPSVERLTGYSSEEIRKMSWKNLLTRDSLKKATDFIALQMPKALNTSSDYLFLKTLELEFVLKNGETVWGECAFSFVRDEKGEILSILGEARNVTERKLAEEKLQKTLDSLKKAVGTTIQVLVTALEAKDPYTAGHQSRSADLACAIAEEMGLDNDRIEGIRMAGTIHDIGKLSIPAEILTKPGKLTNIEFSLIKEHPRSGYDMLKDVDSPWPLADIVRQHHERMNGSGYPDNLKGDDILIEARILAVADVVEAMGSHRPYRASLGIEAALEEIEKNKGILYDTEIADACLKLFREKGYRLT